MKEISVLAYSEGFKYQVRDNDFVVYVGDWGQKINIDTTWLQLSVDGYLTIKVGYAWDGCSGPTWDSRNTMRGGCIHDAGYELIRKRYLPASSKEAVDNTLKEILKADGMTGFRAGYYYQAVHFWGKSSTLPSHKKEILYAP